MSHPDIVDITPLTLSDYPEKVACILWFNNCNLRCKYCYNTSLVLPSITRDNQAVDYLSFLRKRKDFLDGVVLSGGECTLCPDIQIICKQIRDLGFLIKIDTNGTSPDVIRQLIENKLVDYVALDYKAPKGLFSEITGKKDLFQNFSQTLDLLIQSEIEFEVRTTIHPDLLDESAVNLIIDDLVSRNYQGTYYLQYYFHLPKNLGRLSEPTQAFNMEKLSDQIKVELRNFSDLYH